MIIVCLAGWRVGGMPAVILSGNVDVQTPPTLPSAPKPLKDDMLSKPKTPKIDLLRAHISAIDRRTPPRTKRPSQSICPYEFVGPAKSKPRERCNRALTVRSRKSEIATG